MDKNQLKHIIKEEYQNVKSFMEDKYGFTPELGKVISNPYAKSFVNEVSEPEVISQLRDIVNKKQNKKIKDPKSGKMMRVDMFSASAIVKVYDAVNKSNKEKFSKLSLPKMVNVAFTVMKKESVNEDKFYNTRVQYTDPKSKKKFVGDVVRKDGDEYKVNLGKDGRFEKYILAKAKDLKIVSKSKKRTYESVNEAYVVAYGKGPKPIKPAFAAYADKKMAQKFMSDLKKDGYKVMMTQKKIKGIDEGKKRFRQQDGIGKSKYTISYHDGKQKHKDGSDFFGIKIFKNKKDLESFRKDLKKQGYIEESLNEGMFKTIDQIRQDSKDARDFIKNVFSDPDFKDMKNDREFLKYLKSIYEGFSTVEEYDVENYQDVKEFVEFMREYKADINEAEYQGRDVKLGKIMQGDVKKFKVYVKNPKGNVVKVNFGHGGSSAKGKTMKIKKSNPERRKAFRARHNCDNPGPRHKARYWACRTW